MENKPLILKVHDRKGILFEGEIRSLSSENDVGKFDVLFLHANFISLVRNQLVIRLPDGGRQEMNIDTGVLRVEDNEINVYLGTL